MEYIIGRGTKVEIDGDKIIYSNGRVQKNVIGANYVNGVIFGGHLSSFDKSFSDELIGVESGTLENISVKIGDIKEAYELLKTKLEGIDISNILELSRVVLETVDEYFGGIENIESRMDYYYPEDYDEDDLNRISILEHTGAAMCVERSAVSQNLLKSLGINCIYKSSGITKDGHQEAHSYNLIEFNGKYYIYMILLSLV